ncbi:ATP-dependent zinc metalloprotease FtsH [bacterium]|nr:ATP-dependent zinc metalloprotease FtsH [bacterium]
MKNLAKNFIFILLIFLVISAIFALFSQPFEKEKTLAITQLVEEINQEKIKKITVSGNELQIVYQDDSKAKSRKETEAALSQSLINYGVDKAKLAKVEIVTKEAGGTWTWLGPVLMLLFPLLLFGLFFWMIFRQARGSAMQAFDFTKARARLFGAEGQPREKITFKDVAGLKEAKQELMEVVDFLKTPKKYLQMGAKIPRGVMLVGAPGTGKTMLAKAVANESNVPFFSISGSEFVELFVGVGSARVRDLFSTARKTGKAIIFIDEIDSIGKIRGVGVTGGHEEREQTLNQILAEMDGIGREENLIVMGATNRPEYLDPALLRPGRFDRRIVLDLPDINEREEILKIHSRGKPLALNVNLREVAERTPGFSGADLANVVNEAAIFAARRNKHQIFQEEFLESIEKVLLGPERKSHILSKKEKEIAAYHEAGHALVSSQIAEAEPVRKISIVARGLAAGYTLKMPAEERKIKTKSEFLAEMATLLGGYCAEKLKFGEITTGAANDLERASQLARKLVKEYGMSALGPVSFGEREELAFLGREFETGRNYSEKVATKIDREVEKFIKAAENQAKKILTKKKNLLEKISQTLIKKETIERKEFEELIGRHPPTLKKAEMVEPLPKKGKSAKIKVQIRRV